MARRGIFCQDITLVDAVMERLIFFAMISLPIYLAGDRAAAQTDTQLLRQFCETKHIRARECLNAKNYRHHRVCNVKLTGMRHAGRFVSPQTTVLLVGYNSDCETHANEWGGSIVFEREHHEYIFTASKSVSL
jgi:hypothetical protein